MHPVRAAWQIGIGQNGHTASGLDRIDDFLLGTGDQNGANFGLHRAAPDLNNHWLATDVGQRFIGQAHGRHAGGDNNNRIARRRHVRTPVRHQGHASYVPIISSI